MGIVEKFYDILKENADIEKKAAQEGKAITMIITPKKQ
jgi:translation initiation factor IF-3